MFQLLNALKSIKPAHIKAIEQQITKRTFLSAAYHCNEVWSHRTLSPILEKVNLDELYYELDQRYQRTGAISAVDVDIYANKVQDDQHVEELLDLVHKLRMSAETTNTLQSTGHAVIRYLLEHNKKEELLNVIDDRLNYGLFLDYYTANVLMDKFYKERDFVAGCRIASQLMLQEEYDSPISIALGVLHCYNFLLKPESWPVIQPPTEPEEEVKVRVKFLRNPYDDNHFDLKDGLKIVGKTLTEFTRNSQDLLHRSFHLLGLGLQGKHEEAKKVLRGTNEQLYSEVVNLLPDDNALKGELQTAQMQSGEVHKLLEDAVKQAEREKAENDIAEQCKAYNQWGTERQQALERQIERLNVARRIDNIQKTQEELKSREERLWFFQNQENIELAIENKRVYYPKRWFGKKKKPRKVDEGYVPPEL